jgi:hypothetical protein
MSLAKYHNIPESLLENSLSILRENKLIKNTKNFEVLKEAAPVQNKQILVESLQDTANRWDDHYRAYRAVKEAKRMGDDSRSEDLLKMARLVRDMERIEDASKKKHGPGHVDDMKKCSAHRCAYEDAEQRDHNKLEVDKLREKHGLPLVFVVPTHSDS